MGTHIVWQNIWTPEVPLLPGTSAMFETYFEGRYFKKVAREDTKITVQHLKRSSYLTWSIYLEMLNNVELVEGIIQAEKNGMDAVVIGCGNDPALHQAREVVNIPVVGPAETAMHLAAMLGHRFAVVTVLESLIPITERNLRLYGLESRAITCKPVRSCEIPPQEFLETFSRPDKLLLPNFEKTARECIEDGAEVIATACCALGPALTLAGYKEVPGTGVPVIDCGAVGIKMAEMLSDLRKSIGLERSTRGYYNPFLDKEMLQEMRKPFGLE